MMYPLNPPPHRRHTITAFDSTPLEVYTVGRGPKWIVLANGHGGTFDIWSPVLHELPKDCGFVTWDYRSQHRSGRAQSPATIEDHCRDLASVIDYLGLDSFALAGWSLGVQVALQSYRTHSAKVGSLVLIHGAHDQLLHRVLGGRLGALLRGAVRLATVTEPITRSAYLKPLQRFVASPLARPTMRALGMVYRRTDQLQCLANDVLRLDLSTYLQVALNADSHRTEDWLHTVRVPVFVTAGLKDWLTPPAQIQRAFSHFPNASLQRFQGSHFPTIEEPQRLAEVLARAATLAEHASASAP